MGVQTSQLTVFRQLERAQHRRWHLSFSSLSDAVTGTRDMQRALQDPRRKPFRPQKESEEASDDVSAVLICYHDVKERSSPRNDVPAN